MARVLAGSEDDLRWRRMSPSKPQTEAPPKKKKKSIIIKELVDKNTALSQKLNATIEENIHLRAVIEAKGKDHKHLEKLDSGHENAGMTAKMDSGHENAGMTAKTVYPKIKPKPKTKKAVKKGASKTARTKRK